jgi:hypothetical protein
VLVSNTGVVTARTPTTTTTGTNVIASVRMGNVTQADTARVVITVRPAVPQALTNFSVQPQAPDSAKVAVATGGGFFGPGSPVKSFAITSNLTGIPVAWSTSDTTIAKFSNHFLGTVIGKKPGQTLVTASTWVNGVAKTDTFTLTIGAPIGPFTFVITQGLKPIGPGQTILVTNLASASTYTIGPGGTIIWKNQSSYTDRDGTKVTGPTVDLIFDDPPAPIANILGIPADVLNGSNAASNRTIVFPTTPGTYKFHITQLDLTGSVIVAAQ